MPATQLDTPTPAPLLGKPRALDFSSDSTWAGVSAGLAASISAAVPDTSGAAKLVPTAASLPPVVWVGQDGVVVPVLLVLRIG